MDFAGYNSGGVQLAVELVNTRPTDQFPEELLDLESLAKFLVRHDFDVTPSARDLTEVKRVRDELATVFESHDEQVVADTINHVLDRTKALPQLTNHDGEGWHVHYETEGQSVAERIGAIAAGALSEVFLEAGLSRFGCCADGACDTYFVDTSRNASKRFCCERCSTRHAVAAHRARKKVAPGS